MWNDEGLNFGFDSKPKVERLGFLSQSETFSYCNSQMSFLNDDTLDTYSHPPGDVETKTILNVPLDSDDYQNDLNNVEQKGERFPSTGEDKSEELSILGDKVHNEDVTMENGFESEGGITLDIHELENLVDKSTDYDFKTEPEIPDFNKDADLLEKCPKDVVSVETLTESNETNDEVNLLNQDKEEDLKADVAEKKRKRKKSTYKKKWPEDPADCDICGTHYTTKRSYQRHYKIVHELISHDCKHCSQQFRWPDRLTAHIKHVHLGIKKKTYPCDKVMSEPRHLRKHKTKEHPPPGCEGCKLSFQDMEGLQEHIRVEHLQKYCYN